MSTFSASIKLIIKSAAAKIWPISYNRKGSFTISRIIKSIPQYRMSLELDLGQLVDRSYALGFYNKKSIDFLLLELSADCAWFVDAGANLGFYSFAIASMMDRVQCLAIEPDPYSQSKIKANIALNRNDNPQLASQIHLEKCALGTHEGDIDLMINDSGNRAGSSICIDQREFTGKAINATIRVPIKRLSTLLKHYGIDDSKWCLKLDIEGYEYPIINTMLSDLNEEQLPSAIVVEWTGLGILGDNNQTPIQLLQSRGYSLKNIEGAENYLFTKN